MKKILAVLLAALFVVSMSTMAFAATAATVKSGTNLKTKYTVGEKVDLAHLVLVYKDAENKDAEVKFDDATDKTVFVATPIEVAKETTQIKVTYKSGDLDLEAQFSVEVKEPEDKTNVKIIAPTSPSYTVGDTDADFLSKLTITYTDKDGKETTVKYTDEISNFTVSGFDTSKATTVKVTVNYKPAGKSDSIDVIVKEKDAAKIVVKNAKGVYKVGEAFDENLTINYIPEGGEAKDAITIAYTSGDIGVKGFNTSKVAEKVTVTVTYQGLEATYDIAVVEKDRLEKETIVKDLWAAKNDLDARGDASIEDYVQKYTSIISTYMAADDLDDIAKYVDTQDKVQELVQDSSLYPDNWNEFVKVYTDYIPTGVNQALDIAARLGWDASDQDFVQDVIDLVKGAAESDATTTEKAADNGGNGGSSATDANPKTGSTSAIAVFAVLSVAAAAAVVCTKKKED